MRLKYMYVATPNAHEVSTTALTPAHVYLSPLTRWGIIVCLHRRARAAKQAANNMLGSELVDGSVGGGATHGKATATPTMVEIRTTPTTAPPPMSTGGDAGTTKKEAAGGGAATTAVPALFPAPVAAARALFSTMNGATDRQIKAALFTAAAQVLGGTLVLDKMTVIAEGGAKRVQMMEAGREWPNNEFGGLLSAIADAE